MALEIFIHNLSHSDLVLGINDSESSLPRGAIIARYKISLHFFLHIIYNQYLLKLLRPKFSHFRSISRLILGSIQNSQNSDNNDNNPILINQKMLSRQQSNTPSSNKDKEVPIGFNIKKCTINADDVNQGSIIIVIIIITTHSKSSLRIKIS